ncbi:MAG: hypothetical protein CBC03_17370 [Pseudoalteromonas sp. TMED43]|nr:MAG: hypothetical protein CBC03_17370 [Pseudoalteromonas sp. TMED43]|tara:strand:+ start:368 stop:568 length:201 start_codon:yes stop_codon:yes gene_type:complete
MSIIDWYGRNNIGWGETYEIVHAGNVNEANYWGYIYPFNFDGSVFAIDSSIVKADNTKYTTDQTKF